MLGIIGLYWKITCVWVCAHIHGRNIHLFVCKPQYHDVNFDIKSKVWVTLLYQFCDLFYMRGNFLLLFVFKKKTKNLYFKFNYIYNVTKFPNLSKVCVNLKKTQILFSRKLISNMLLENFQICWMDV